MNKKENLLIIGAGGHAKSCIDVVEQEGRFNIAGLVGADSEVGTHVTSYSVLGADKDLPNLLKEYDYVLIAIGQIKTAQRRIELFNEIKNYDCELPVIISPSAYVSPHASIGEGTLVSHKAVVNANAIIGKNCIINTGAIVEHDAKVSDHCHISTNTVLNGGVVVGKGTFVGSASCVKENVLIGEHCVIAMGELVKSNCSDKKTVVRGKVV